MTLEEAKKIVFEVKPEFAKLYKEYGNKTWQEYANDNYKIQGLTDTLRQQEFVAAFRKILSPLLSEEKISRAILALKENNLVSTSDHHGILCHPFFSNTTLVRSFTNETNKSIIALTCGGISPSNSSYPRGIFFHDENLKEIHLPFLSLHNRRRSLYGLKNLSKLNFEKQKEKIKNFKIGADKKNKLETLLTNIIESKKVFEQETLSNQYTVINDILWGNIFGEKHGNLVYLEIETLVRELLLSYHIENETDIHKTIFESETRKKYIKNFEKIIGAHSTEDEKGSHIFWYIDNENNTRKQLFVHEDYLVSLDKKISIQITPKNINNNLLEYKLLPSMALCYSIISFYYGLTLGGGFSQIQYLGDMKEAFKKTISDTYDTKTNIFTGEFVLLTIGNDSEQKPASLIDLLIHNNPEEKKVKSEISNKKISETLDLMMPEFIEIVTGKKEMLDLPHKSLPSLII